MLFDCSHSPLVSLALRFPWHTNGVAAILLAATSIPFSRLERNSCHRSTRARSSMPAQCPNLIREATRFSKFKIYSKSFRGRNGIQGQPPTLD
jgi:hypothetical protein